MKLVATVLTAKEKFDEDHPSQRKMYGADRLANPVECVLLAAGGKPSTRLPPGNLVEQAFPAEKKT